MFPLGGCALLVLHLRNVHIHRKGVGMHFFFFFFFPTCATIASVVAQEATTSVVPTSSAAVVSLHCISLLVWELSFYVERDSQMLTVSGSFCVCIYRYI